MNISTFQKYRGANRIGYPLVLALFLSVLLGFNVLSAETNPAESATIDIRQIQLDMDIIASNSSPGAAENALRELDQAGSIAEEAEPLLAALLLDENHSSLQRRLAAVALCRWVAFSPSALSALTLGLKAQDDKTAAQCAACLGSVGETARSSVPALCACLQSNLCGPSLRREAARALGRIAWEPELSVPALVNVLQHSDNDDQTIAIVSAIGQFSSQAGNAAPELARLLNAPESKTALRNDVLATLVKVAVSVSEQSRYMNAIQLFRAWCQLHTARQSLTNADIDQAQQAMDLLDQSLATVLIASRHDGLCDLAVIVLVYVLLFMVSAFFVGFFPVRAQSFGRWLDKIETRTGFNLPLFGWPVRVPRIPIGTIFKYLLIFGFLLKFAANFNRGTPGGRKKQTKTKQTNEIKHPMKTKTLSITRCLLVLAGLALLVLAPGTLSAEDQQEQSDNERMTQQAWNALNKPDCELAIQKTESCIKEFRPTADALQKELKDRGEPLPPVGDVPDKTQRKQIFNRGPLNDVCTCYFIAGEAQFKLAETSDAATKQQHLLQAKADYEAAARYTYARTWDPRGWFWDPSAKANERLENMDVIAP